MVVHFLKVDGPVSLEAAENCQASSHQGVLHDDYRDVGLTKLVRDPRNRPGVSQSVGIDVRFKLCGFISCYVLRSKMSSSRFVKCMLTMCHV